MRTKYTPWLSRLTEEITLFFLMVILFLFQSFPISAKSNRVIYVRPVDSATLDPEKAVDVYSYEVISNIFEGLVCTESDPLRIVPCLAKSWEVKDQGKKWVFQLKRGIRFHNGEHFNAAVVVRAFNRRLKNKSRANRHWQAMFPYLVRVASSGPYLVEFYLSQPFLPFLTSLGSPMALIPAPAAHKEKEFNPIGTGPYMYAGRDSDKSIVLSANQTYWGGPVKISRLIFKTIAKSFPRISQIKNGNANISKIYSLDEKELLLGKKEVTFLSSHSIGTHYLAFNTVREPFTNPAIRRAVAHLINKEMLMRHSFQDLAFPAITPIPPQMFGFNHNIKDYEYNLEKARSIFEKAGLKKGFTCSLYYTATNPALQKIVDVIAANAKRIHLTIKKVPLPFPELVKLANRGGHDMIIMGWVGSPDPYLFLAPVFARGEGLRNRAFYVNPGVSKLLEKYRSSLSKNNARRMIEQVQEILFHDSPWIPLYHLKNTIVHNSSIKNLRFDANGFVIFKDAWCKEKNSD